MAPWLLTAAYAASDRLQHIWADMAYRGQRLRTWVEEECGWTLEIAWLGLIDQISRCTAAASAVGSDVVRTANARGLKTPISFSCVAGW